MSVFTSEAGSSGGSKIYHVDNAIISISMAHNITVITFTTHNIFTCLISLDHPDNSTGGSGFVW